MPIFILRGLQVYNVPVCVLQARHSKFWPVLYFIVSQTLLSCTRVEKVMISCFPTAFRPRHQDYTGLILF